MPEKINVTVDAWQRAQCANAIGDGNGNGGPVHHHPQTSKHEKPFCFWVDPDFCVIAAPYVSSTSRSLNWQSDQRNDHHNNTKYQHYSLLLLLLYEHFATFSQLASLQCSPAPRLADWLTCY